MDQERFARPIVGVLAQRAGNICSNPDCAAHTSGPAENPNKSLNVGEAAHIYGARPGSARFDSAMSVSARGDVTNGIWLCRNCHKLIDSDVPRHPAELLFEWRRSHESTILAGLGKTGAIRERIIQRRLEGFESSSYLAQQIILDLPDFWEFKLTAELLRSLVKPIKRRWESLEQGLYAKPHVVINTEDFPSWAGARMSEMGAQVQALSAIVNSQLRTAWGPPGEQGSAEEIHRTCALMAEACQRILEWEECVRFIEAPQPFEELHDLLIGIAGAQIVKVVQIPAWIDGIFAEDNPTGEHAFELVFDLPEGWEDRIAAAMKRAEHSLGI